MFLLALLLVALLVVCSESFVVGGNPRFAGVLRSSPFDNDSSGDLTVDELKAELEMRSIDYSNVITKNDLLRLLREARVTGKADPSIVDRWNELSTDDVIQDTIEDEDLQDLVGKDGNLPGGMSPEMMKQLAAEPELQQMLRDPTMQAIMKDVMQGGPDAIKKYLADADAMLMLQKLSGVLGKLMK